MKTKEEFPPLLTAGVYDMKVEEIEPKFVAPFTNKTHREYVLKRFLILYRRLRSFGVNMEVWMNGSFLTEKEKPDDIDAVIFTYPREINSLPKEKQEEFALLTNNDESKLRYSCDIHSHEIDDTWEKIYWRGLFGFSRTEQPKGFVRLIE